MAYISKTLLTKKHIGTCIWQKFLDVYKIELGELRKYDKTAVGK